MISHKAQPSIDFKTDVTRVEWLVNGHPCQPNELKNKLSEPAYQLLIKSYGQEIQKFAVEKLLNNKIQNPPFSINLTEDKEGNLTYTIAYKNFSIKNAEDMVLPYAIDGPLSYQFKTKSGTSFAEYVPDSMTSSCPITTALIKNPDVDILPIIEKHSEYFQYCNRELHNVTKLKYFFPNLDDSDDDESKMTAHKKPEKISTTNLAKLRFNGNPVTISDAKELDSLIKKTFPDDYNNIRYDDEWINRITSAIGSSSTELVVTEIDFIQPRLGVQLCVKLQPRNNLTAKPTLVTFSLDEDPPQPLLIMTPRESEIRSLDDETPAHDESKSISTSREQPQTPPTWWEKNKWTVGKVALGVFIGALLVGGTILTMGALGFAAPGMMAISMGVPLSSTAVGTGAFASAAGTTTFIAGTIAGGAAGGLATAAAPDFFTRHKKKILTGVFLSLAVIGIIAASIFGFGVGGIAAAFFFSSIGSALGLTAGTSAAVGLGMGIAVATPLLGVPILASVVEKSVEYYYKPEVTATPAVATDPEAQANPTGPSSSTDARLATEYSIKPSDSPALKKDVTPITTHQDRTSQDRAQQQDTLDTGAPKPPKTTQ